jgi:hypothetical protein
VQLQESWWYGFVGTGYNTRFRATAYPKAARRTTAASVPPLARTP